MKVNVIEDIDVSYFNAASVLTALLSLLLVHAVVPHSSAL
jgi:hypothetical protein